MKNFLFFLPIFIIVLTAIPFAYAVVPPKTSLQLYQESDVIVLGNVVSAEPFVSSDGLDQTKYAIQIIQPIKSDLQTDMIDVIGLGSKDATRHLSDEIIFEQNQKVFLLLYQSNNMLYVSPHSITAQNFDPDSDFILPPLKLFRAGIITDQIHCKSNLELIIKATDNSPACVSSDTANNLKNRGWAIDLSHTKGI